MIKRQGRLIPSLSPRRRHPNLDTKIRERSGKSRTITGSLAMLYKMVFVPFTAIDNHRKCVAVVAGLLKNKTTKSYIWLLKAFMKAFGKSHSIVVTDQDGAMRNAIEAEFGGSKHRLCMCVSLKILSQTMEVRS
ncbi:FAR1-related sequence 5-like protein [Tanacetum coccineum]